MSLHTTVSHPSYLMSRVKIFSTFQNVLTFRMMNSFFLSGKLRLGDFQYTSLQTTPLKLFSFQYCYQCLVLWDVGLHCGVDELKIFTRRSLMVFHCSNRYFTWSNETSSPRFVGWGWSAPSGLKNRRRSIFGYGACREA